MAPSMTLFLTYGRTSTIHDGSTIHYSYHGYTSIITTLALLTYLHITHGAIHGAIHACPIHGNCPFTRLQLPYPRWLGHPTHDTDKYECETLNGSTAAGHGQPPCASFPASGFHSALPGACLPVNRHRGTSNVQNNKITFLPGYTGD